MTLSVFLASATAVFLAVHPAICIWADRVVARRRLTDSSPGLPVSVTRQPVVSVQNPSSALLPKAPTHDHAEVDACDYLASLVRAGTPSRDALISLCHARVLPPQLAQPILQSISTDTSIDVALSHIRANWKGDTPLFIDCLCSSHRDGVLIPAALDYSRHILSDHLHAQQSKRINTAYARTTTRLLTGLPFVSALLAMVFSQSLRDIFMSTQGLFLIGVGIALNGVGWWWMHLVTSRATELLAIPETQRLAHSFGVSLASGSTVIQACELWKDISPCGRAVSLALQHGESLQTALSALSRNLGASGHILEKFVREAHTTGIPTRETIARFSQHLHQSTLSHHEERVRQLPAQLSLPVVLCVLPSFLVVVLIPIALVSLRSLPLT